MTNNEKMNIIKFCEINNINWRPIKLNIIQKADGKYEKQLKEDLITGKRPKLDDFRDANWVKTKMKKSQKQITSDYYTHIAIDTIEIYNLDIDWEEGKSYTPEAKLFVKSMIEQCPYYRSSTKAKGKHILFKTDEPIHKYTHKLFSKGGDLTYEDLEILSGNWAWAKKDTTIDNNGEIPTLKLDDYKHIIKDNFSKKGATKKIIMKKKPKVCASVDKPEDSYLFKKMDLIKREYMDEYDTWIKILFSLKSYKLLSPQETYTIAKYISAKSPKFNIQDFHSKYDGLVPTNTITIGTALHYAKISNPIEYNKIRLTEMETEDLDFLGSDETLANLYLDENASDIVLKVNKHLYTFIANSVGSDEGRWVLDTTKNVLKYNVGAFLSTLFTDLYKKLISRDDDKRIANQEETIYKLTAKVKNVSKINSVVEKLLHIISVNNYDHIEFDTNGYLFAFNNKVYDLKSHNWLTTKRDNYILTTTGYDWEEPTEEQMTRIEDLFCDVFDDVPIRMELIHLLSTALYGIAVEKFIIANGDGGNGKGVISELMGACLGNYYYNGNNAVLLAPIKQGGNPEIANMEGKRMVVFREPSEYKKLDLSVIKEITGGDKISARKLFSNETEVKLCATHFLEVNKRLGMSGDVGHSVIRRLRDIPYKTEFSTDEDMINNKEMAYVKRADNYYKSEKFKQTHKCAMIKMLIDYTKCWEFDEIKYNPDNLNVCDKQYEAEEITERTQQYIENQDMIFVFLNTHYIETKDVDNDLFRVQDFYQLFKNGDFYQNLTKNERNGSYSYKSICEYFKTKGKLRKYFKAREDRTGDKYKDKKYYGKNIKTIIKGWRERTSDEMEEASDDEDEFMAE
tara:strand:+ start:972 stop:3527 length:2556 start_codon:yes stop_codon:yes gene_type:complete